MSEFGRFTGEVEASWPHDRPNEMKVLRTFDFIDPEGRRWHVPAGTETDGASIPRFFWRSVGSPFNGRYRRAAVVHDRYCDTRVRSWKDTHRVFYFAMRADGCTWLQAIVMWLAVRLFGPRW